MHLSNILAWSSCVITSSIRPSSGTSAAGSATGAGAGFAFSEGWLVCANVGDDSSIAMMIVAPVTAKARLILNFTSR